MAMFDFMDSKKRLFIVYPNGLIKPYKWFRQTDTSIETRDKKLIIASRSHAYVDSKNGTQYYFVNGEEDKTSPNPTTFKCFKGKKIQPEFNRESMFKVHHNLLVKSMHGLLETSFTMILFYCLVGAGVGWIMCDAFGNNEVYNQQQYSENYYPQEPEENNTVIITTNLQLNSLYELIPQLEYFNKWS